MAIRDSRGIGDVIEYILISLGIKKVVKWFSDKTGIDCGCDERQQSLNEAFPFYKTKCLELHQYEFICSLQQYDFRYWRDMSKKDPDLFDKIHEVHWNVFYSNRKQKRTTPCFCSTGTWRNMINELYRMADIYDETRNNI